MPLSRSGVLFSPPGQLRTAAPRNAGENPASERGTHTPPKRYSDRTEIVRPLREGLNCTVPACFAKIV